MLRCGYVFSSCLVFSASALAIESIVETIGFEYAWVDGNDAAYRSRNDVGNDLIHTRLEFSLTEEFDSGLEFDFWADVDPADANYDLELGLSHYDWGELEFCYRKFSTLDYPVGAYLSETDEFYDWSGDALALDSELFSVSAKLLKGDLPEVTFKYTRKSRNGEKGSTIWSENNQTRPATGVKRGIVPAVLGIDETKDTIELGVEKDFSTFDVAMSYRFEELESTEKLYLDRSASDPDTNRKVTQSDSINTTSDFVKLGVSTRSLWENRVWLTLTSSFLDLSSDFSGNRIYGDAFEQPYSAEVGKREHDDSGYRDLVGNSEVDQFMTHANALIALNKNWKLLLSGRLKKISRNSFSDFVETGLGVIPRSGWNSIESSREGAGEDDYDEVQGQLELRYSKWDWCKFYLRTELSEGDGYVKERFVGGMIYPLEEESELQYARENDYARSLNRSILGGSFVLTKGLSLNARYVFTDQTNEYEPIFFESGVSSRMLYPNYISQHDKNGGKARISLNWRASPKLRFSTLLNQSNYNMDTTGIESDLVESGDYKDRSISQSVFWTVNARLQFSVLGYYTNYEMQTPANLVVGSVESIVPVVDADSIYLNFSGNYLFKNETYLGIRYSRLETDSYRDNSMISVPYGSLLEEDTIDVSYEVPVNENTKLNFGYYFQRSRDPAYSSYLDYDAHQLYMGMKKVF